MTLVIDNDIEDHLHEQKPVFLGPIKTKQPKGALGDLGPDQEIETKGQWIAPLNTDIMFADMPVFSLSAHPGLMAISPTEIPINFNWRDDGPSDIRRNIATPGNQLLCGSCWAISAAGIVGDNHVVSKKVHWKPMLSTTYSLACYPQLQCKGGNPAKLLAQIAKNGLTSNNCIDYGWCENNDKCNGTALKHFKASAEMDLSSLLPGGISEGGLATSGCGCVFSTDHYLYKIDDPPKTMSLGRGDLTERNFALTVKKHIKTNGPVLGGFLVFKNFMHGVHAKPKLNNGVYLETGTYHESGVLQFDEEQVDPTQFAGAHAVAVIGWGVAKGTVIDNKGTKRDVPYWLARNSWGPTWGDRGYFKMAMYPYNKISQFDKMVPLQTPKGNVLSAGMVAITASAPPVLRKLEGIPDPEDAKAKNKPDSYYKAKTHTQGQLPPPNPGPGTSHGSLKKVASIIGLVIASLVGCLLLGLAIFYLVKALQKKGKHNAKRVGYYG